MVKQVLYFVVGCIAGALGGYLLMPSLQSPYARPGEAPFGESLTTSATRDALWSQASAATSVAVPDSRELGDLEGRVEDDPIAALRDAAELSDLVKRRQAVMLVGTLWARIDPEAALPGGVSTLPGELQADFRARVASEWANLDAEEFLSYADNASDLGALREGLSLLIASDPARVLEIANRLPGEMGSLTNSLQMAALGALAERNPKAAMLHIESFPPGIVTITAVQEVVSRFARNDPDAALAWLDTLDAPPAGYRGAVISGIASVDFARAYELATVDSTAGGELLASALANAALSDSTRVAEAASKLLNEQSSFAVQVIQRLLGAWARRDPDKLADWILFNSHTIDPPLARSIARQFAANDVEAATALLDRLPLDMRETWIAQVAGPYASQDPLAALHWIQQYQGQAFYGDIHSQVIMQLADTNPNVAATLVDGLPSALRSAAAPRIAGALSAQDPKAAAEWALNLPDSAAVPHAVNRVVSDWIQRDVESATNWVVGLQRGRTKDEALSVLISASYGTNLDPRPILDEIESEDVRRQATRMAVYRSAPGQVEIAKELLEKMLDYPEYGDWARESLARIRELVN